jgi:hypothetical protein
MRKIKYRRWIDRNNTLFNSPTIVDNCKFTDEMFVVYGVQPIEYTATEYQFDGLFHAFGLKDNNSVALVELSNGEILQLKPTDIKFVN